MLDKYNMRKLQSRRLVQLQRKNIAIHKLIKSKKRLIKRNKKLQNDINLLKLISYTDKLTGLYNRNYLNKLISKKLELSNQYFCQFSIMIIDIDEFKKLNDYYGHSVGDQALVSMGQILRTTTRKSDVCIRWGGDEFLILMPKTTLAEAYIVSEKLKKCIASIKNPVAKQITASFGIIQRSNGEKWTGCFKRADRALYDSKRLKNKKIQNTNLSPYNLKKV